MSSLVDRLRDGDFHRFLGALREARTMGEEGDAALVLERHLRHSTRRIENPFVQDAHALCYLARHVGEAGSQRTTKLVNLIRTHWSNWDRREREWLERRWPATAPGGPTAESVEPPDAQAIMEEARFPYFTSIALDILCERPSEPSDGP